MNKWSAAVLGCVGLVWLGAAHAAVDWNARLNAAFSEIRAVPAVAALRAGTQSTPRRELTLLLAQARLHWNELAPDTQKMALPWMARPTKSGVSFESGWLYGSASETTEDTAHFRVHYLSRATYPTNANAATTAFVNEVKIALEEVYTAEHTTFGYAAVPSDLGSSTNGGDALFDVYLTNTGGSGIYGYVYAEGYTVQTGDYAAWSYMVLDNNFSEFFGDALDSLKVTVAHEYFHAIQFGYSAKEEGSFQEHASTWMEDMVYPGIHDNYQYLGEPYTDTNGNGQYEIGEPFTDRRTSNGIRDEGMLDFPEYPLDAYDVEPMVLYGRFLWARYLYEKFDGAMPSSNGIIKRIFAKSAQVSSVNTFAAIDSVLQSDYASSIAVAFQEYATWLYDNRLFSDGANYPLVWVDRGVSGTDTAFSSIDSPGLILFNQSSGGTQFYLSSVYTQITNPTGSYQFVSAGGAPALTLLVDSGGGTLTHEKIPLTNGTGTWTPPGGATRAIAVISNVSTSSDGLDWTLRASGKTSTVAPTLVSVTFGSGQAESWSSGAATLESLRGKRITFSVAAIDGDGTTPRFKVISDATGGHFDPSTNTFDWSTSGAPAGNYTVQLAAYDAVDARVSTTGTITIALQGSGSRGGGGWGGTTSPEILLLGLVLSLLRFCSNRDTTRRSVRCRIQSALRVYTRRR